MRPTDLAAYLFLALAWGLSFLVLLKVVAAFGWVGAVTFRCFIAAATLLLAARILRRTLTFQVGWFPFAVVGATTVAGQLLGLSIGTPLIGTAMAAIIVATIPLFSMLIGHVWGLEQMTADRLLGLLLGFGGIILLVGFPSEPVTPDFILGCLCTLAACLCAAFGSNYASARLRGVGSWEVTVGAFLSGAVMTLPLLLLVPVPTTPGLSDFGYLLVAGAVMSALTYITYFRLVGIIGATKAISVEFAVTLVAVFVGAVVLGESLSLLQGLGAAVILLGCMIVLGLVPRRLFRLS